MKKTFSMAVVALFVSMTANAQIGESKSKKIETTYTTTTNVQEIPEVEEKPEYKNYDRIYMSYAPTRITEYYANFDNLMMHGVGLGWKKGINVTGKRLPLYLETGIAANFAFGEGDKLFNFVIPINVTYRFKIASTKIYIGPYWGLNFKINYLWDWDRHDRSWFDYDSFDAKRFQMGTELGCNFDIYNFHLGVGWGVDFMKLATPSFSNSYGIHNFKTSGVRVNVGVTF